MLLVIALLPLFAGATEPPKNPEFVMKDEPTEPLVPSDIPVRRNDVYDLKVRLQQLGLYKGPIDDVYDETAVSAVKEFQKSYWQPLTASWKRRHGGPGPRARPVVGRTPRPKAKWSWW